MKKMELRKVQLLLLEAFKEVDQICKKYKIKYYMAGGTLLGAVRHKGFIPWDQDLDIAMMREDYDRFLSLCPGELPDRYFIQNYHTDGDFYPAMTRICINGTFVDDKYTGHLNSNKGAFIDIFPLDNVPDDNKLQKKHEKSLQIIDKIMFYKACIIYRKGPLFSKLLAKKILKFLLSPICLKFLQRLRENVMKEYSDQNTSRVCRTSGKYGYKKEMLPRSAYGEPVLLEFEGDKYYAPHDWDLYLKQLYGSYMAMPPDDKRKPDYNVYEV